MKTRIPGCLLFCLISLFFSSCSKYVDNERSAGPEVRVGNGSMTSYSVFSSAGVPESIGIEISPGALKGLSNSQHGTYVLTLDDQVKKLTPFDHIVVDWNPHGHMPANIYDVAHFDFHFYMINNAERMAIGSWETDSVALKKDPPLVLLPETYFAAASDPQMGKHWVDKNAVELNNGVFTRTFIYGTYNGRVNFLEPMIAKSFMDAGSTFTDVKYPQPKMYSPINSWFPTTYSATINDRGNYCVSLGGFQWR